MSTTPCREKNRSRTTPINIHKKDIYSHSRYARDRGWWTSVHLVHLSTYMHVQLPASNPPRRDAP